MSKDQPLAVPPAPIPPPTDTGADAPDPSALLAEEHLRVLAELREIGMEMTRILKRRAEIDLQSAEKLANHATSDDAYLMPPPLPGPMRDPAAAFARLSRAVRLTLALEARTAEALRALRAGLSLEGGARRSETGRAEDAERLETAKAAAHSGEASGTADALPADDVRDLAEFAASDRVFRERLTDQEGREGLAGRPLRDVVESLCLDLRLAAADSSPWSGEGLAREKARLTQLSMAAETNRARLVQWPRTPPPAPPPLSAAPPTRGRTGPGSRC